MTSPASWRQFQLYDFTPIRDPNSSETESSLFSDASVSAINASGDTLLVADHNAYVKLVSMADFTLRAQFIAYDLHYRITFIGVVPDSSLVVTLAEHQGSPSCVKLWDLDKMAVLARDEDDLRYKYQSQVLVTNGDNSFPVSCFAYTPQLSCLAVGYANGKVVLVRGDIVRDRGSKQRVVYESTSPVTGVRFVPQSDSLLYICTTSRVVTVATARGQPERVLSSAGVDLHCSDVFGRELVCATSSAIKFYNVRRKGRTIAFDGHKNRVLALPNSHILLCSSEENNNKLVSRVLILDLANNHVAFNLLIPHAMLREAFVAESSVFLLCNDGVLYRVHQKPINQQVELVVQRQLYAVAYSLAKQAQLSSEQLLRIQKLHIDHLYDERLYDEAIAVAIDSLDLFKDANSDAFDDFVMSIIIRFNDTGNIANLTSFLAALYRDGLAQNDHITLLLCCYCKLKELPRIEEFIEGVDVSLPSLQNLDYSLIINLFKECGYYEAVIALLRKLGQPQQIVEIQLKDLKQPKTALAYIKSLPVDDLLLILIDYTKTLLDYHPIDTTRLLIEVFTGRYSPETEGPPPQEEERKEGPGLTSYQGLLKYLKGSSDEPEPEAPKEPTYLPPRPHVIFTSFLNHPHEFIIFLEACLASLEKYQGNQADQRELLTTLLEMYLKLGQEDAEWNDKATELVEQNGPVFDDASLLLVSHIYDFSPGEIRAKESGYQSSLFAQFRANGDVSGCYKIATESKDPELYRAMITTVVASRDNFEQLEKNDVKKLLERVISERIMTPLEVLKCLTENGQEFVPLGLVKDLLIDHLEQQQREITTNSKLIENYEQESSANSLKLTELTKKPFVIQNTKCSECNQRLEFPVVHFKCKHSYHQKCLSNNLVATSAVVNGGRVSDESHCPKCFQVVDEPRNFDSRDEIEVFDSSLAQADDKFKVVSDYFGRGVMDSDATLVEAE
ncbi:E3 ubiquitin-protein ligase Pep5p [Diutina catenulata]